MYVFIKAEFEHHRSHSMENAKQIQIQMVPVIVNVAPHGHKRLSIIYNNKIIINTFISHIT